MKRSYSWKVVVSGFAVAGAMHTATVSAADQFTTLAEVPTEVLSQSEMATIEGKVFTVDLLGPKGPLSFSESKRTAPLATVDLNSLLKPPKGQQLSAFAFLTPKDLFALIPGKNGNPLISYNASALSPPIR